MNEVRSAMPSRAEPGVIYLIDAHSLIFQVFHAIPAMTSPSGLPTNAVFGFVRDLMFLRRKKPDYLVCAFDRPEPTFRSDLYPDYKAHREPVPDDLVSQLPLILRAVEALHIPVVSHPKYEADDVMATLARAASKRGLDVYLCTSDKDCRQLIDDHIRLYNLRKKQEFGRPELLADWGVAPEQVVDLQALVGDPVDNVPGVPGVGVKTAAKLLQEFGTLDNLLANVDKVAGAKRQENLRAAKGVVALSRSLVRLADDVPAPLEWDAWKLRDIDVPKMLELCRELGLRTLANEIREGAVSAGPVQATLFPDEDERPFSRDPEGSAGGDALPSGSRLNETAPTAAVPWFQDYHLVDTPEKFEAFYRRLVEQTRFAFDLETTSLSPLQAAIVGLAFSWEPGERTTWRCAGRRVRRCSTRRRRWNG